MASAGALVKPIPDNTSNASSSEEPEPSILSSGAANLNSHNGATAMRPTIRKGELKLPKSAPPQLLSLPVSNLPDYPPVETMRSAVVRPQRRKPNGEDKENLWASGSRMPPQLNWYFERVEAKYGCPQDEPRLPRLDAPIYIPVMGTERATDSEWRSGPGARGKMPVTAPPGRLDKCFVILKKFAGQTGGPAQTYLAANSSKNHKQRDFRNYLVLRTYSKDKECSLETLKRELSTFKRLSESVTEGGSLGRRCILGLDAVFANNEDWFFAMPVMRCNLAHVLTRERADVTETVRHEFSKSWITQLAIGIDHLHNHGIIHSNLKPCNILLDWDGSVKISDFSCAYVQSVDEPLQNYPAKYANKFCGSLPYMAPEQRAISKSVKKAFGKEVDIWALGCIAAELCRDDHYKLLFEFDGEFENFVKGSESVRREYLHQYAIPTHFQVEFILRLLEPNVSKRAKIAEFEDTQYYKMNKNLKFIDYAKKRLRAEAISDFLLEFDLSKDSISKNSDALVAVSLEERRRCSLLGHEVVLPWIPLDSRWAP